MVRRRLRSALVAATLGSAACGDGSGSALRERERPGLTEPPVNEAPSAGLPGQRVFADDQVLEVRLTLPPEALRQLEAHGDAEEYVSAEARLQGRGQPASEFAEIGVRHKGSWSLHHCWDDFGGVRSYAEECAKLSFKLKFDAYREDSRYDGLKRLNLHAALGDPSKLRELLAYRTFRDFGVDAPRAIPAQLFVNGEPLGLFIAVEDVDGRYARAHFPESPDGNLYKEVWPSPLASDEDFLAALETNEERADVSDLRAFTDAVASATSDSFQSAVEPFVELDALLRYIAVDRALRNWDGVMSFYSPLSSHNFYWYQLGPGSRFALIPWDLDNTFWAFDPYTDPQQWVTAEPIPDFNSRPLDCSPRPIWEPTSIERVTPPRCDPLLNLLAETHWQRLVELGTELVEGPLAASRLLALADDAATRLAPIVAADPLLDSADWNRARLEFEDIVRLAGPSFEAFLAEGLIDEAPTGPPLEATPPNIDALTSDAGLHVGGITNFEFGAPPPSMPSGVFVYGDPLSTVSASWNTEQALSGAADLRFDFSFQRGPGLYDEWAGLGLASAESDIRGYSSIVVWMSADRPRHVRVRVDSPAYQDAFSTELSEFGIDYEVGITPQPFVIELSRLYYPSWAKDAWRTGQGFPGSDAEALDLVLQHFTALVFGPSATVDTKGELSAASETGYLRIDNVYFR
jgi:hypothetical protein